MKVNFRDMIDHGVYSLIDNVHYSEKTVIEILKKRNSKLKNFYGFRHLKRRFQLEDGSKITKLITVIKVKLDF